MKYSIFLYLILFLFSCKENKTNKLSLSKEQFLKDSLNNELNKNIAFISDSLFNGNRKMIAHSIRKYQIDSCWLMTYTNKRIKENFEGIKALPDINGDNKLDTVFILPPFNWCEEGESYYFTDTTLPRIFSDSYCCHPNNFFAIEDIDEDGKLEIGIYVSSCVSRYKRIEIYSLKNNKWQNIGVSAFDILTKDPTTVDFKTLVKKIKKNEFKMCHFFEGKTTWKTEKMN